MHILDCAAGVLISALGFPDNGVDRDRFPVQFEVDFTILSKYSFRELECVHIYF